MSAKKRAAAKTAKASRPWRRRLLALGGIAVACAGIVLYAQHWLASPNIKLLVPEHGARWIREGRPFKFVAWGPTQEVVIFRKRVRVPAAAGSPELTVRALRTCMVFWDRQRVLVAADPKEWKEPHRIKLQDLTPGEHTLEIFVEDSFGPAALLVYCDALGLKSGPDWEDQVLGEAWQPVLTADDVEPPISSKGPDSAIREDPGLYSWTMDFGRLSQRLDSPIRALVRSLWWLGPLFLAVWGALIWISRRAGADGTTTWWSASRCRWIVLAAWLVLAANNFLKLPADMGYDQPAHVEYIRFIADRGELPDAHDGWQMFQAPLYYAMAAGIYRVLTTFVASGTALLWLRWSVLLCGVAQVEICFRAGRCVFPDRQDLQTPTVLLGGLLPMNLYMSQTLGNEPLCGVLTALLLLWGWQVLREPDSAQQPLWQWRLGLVSGLNLLTKMSALLLAPIIAVVLAVANRRRGFAPFLTAVARCFVAVVVVSGWYYVRNWLRFGKPFVGGWDPVRGILWWQDPGYRTAWQMVSFGRSLFQPIHAGFYSIWDGFFATLWLDSNFSGLDYWKTPPPWNMTLMLAAPWPALVLSAAIGAGLLRAVWCRDLDLRRSLQFAGGTLLLYVAAFILLCLEVPAFSQAKASYTLGLTPVYAVLCVAGLDLLPSNRVVRSAASAFVVCWCVLVYGTYFAL
jgi:hypothetical protein